MSESEFNLCLNTIRCFFRRWIPRVTALLLLAYAVTQWARYDLSMALGGRWGLIQLFDFGGEANLPSMFSTILILVPALLLGFIAWVAVRERDRQASYWIGLALIFLFLCFDEGAALHERWSFFIWQYVETTGILKDAWLIPIMFLLVVFGVAYLRFLVRLPADSRWRFVAAGVVFVSAAVGFEMIEGLWQTNYGKQTPGYAILVGIEEVLEIVGITMFIDALLRHLIVHVGITRLTLR